MLTNWVIMPTQKDQTRLIPLSLFGQDSGDDGEIDRKVLGSKVFGSPESLKKLTDIVWSAIKKMAQQEIESVRAQQPKQVIVLKRLYCLKLVGRILSMKSGAH